MLLPKYIVTLIASATAIGAKIYFHEINPNTTSTNAMTVKMIDNSASVFVMFSIKPPNFL